jgi:hypothetical protein
VEEFTKTLLCPSSQPHMDGSFAFAAIDTEFEEALLTPLVEPLSVTEELITLAGSSPLTELFRFAAPCANNSCAHFDGSKCTLAKKAVHLLPEATELLPPCLIRLECRWFHQEGKLACTRCPQVKTNVDPSSELSQKVSPKYILDVDE